MLQKIVVFRLNDQQYSVNVSEIQSIEHVSSFTSIPQVERYFKGIVHLRGEVIPIIDLKLKLNMDATDITNMTKVIITKIDDLSIGFLVDEATEVLDINVNEMESPTDLTNKNGYIIDGVIKLEDELILLIQFNNILNEQDLTIVRELVKAKQ